VADVHWITERLCQVSEEIYYESVDRHFVATTERGERESVAVEVVLFDNDFVYPHKWKISGGIMAYPEDPLETACRVTRNAHGKSFQGMKRAGVIREMVGRKKTVTYVYFAPIDMNSEVDMQRVSLTNKKNYQVSLLDQCLSLAELRSQWERAQSVKYKSEGVWRPKNTFSQQMKKGKSSLAKYLMRKKGRHFDIHIKMLVWIKDGCTHGYMMGNKCGCTVRMVGQRQFLGFVFQSSLIRGWVKCFINSVSDGYWIDEERVRCRAMKKLRGPMRQQYRDKFKIEWALGGTLGRTGWVGFDVEGTEDFPRYLRVMDPNKGVNVRTYVWTDPEGKVLIKNFISDK